MEFLILVALLVVIWLLWTLCRNTGDALDKQTALQYEVVALEKQLEQLLARSPEPDSSPTKGAQENASAMGSVEKTAEERAADAVQASPAATAVPSPAAEDESASPKPVEDSPAKTPGKTESKPSTKTSGKNRNTGKNGAAKS